MEINWMRESSAFSPLSHNCDQIRDGFHGPKEVKDAAARRGESLDLNMVDWRPAYLHEWGVAHARLAWPQAGSEVSSSSPCARSLVSHGHDAALPRLCADRRTQM